MSYKIQITVDEQLNQTIKTHAQQMGLSVSSYARLALKRVLEQNSSPLLEQAIQDVSKRRVENLTLDEFNQQLDRY